MHLAFGIWDLAFGIWDLPFTICHLPFAICHLPFAFCHLPFAIEHLPLPFAIEHSPLSTRHLHIFDIEHVALTLLTLLSSTRARLTIARDHTPTHDITSPHFTEKRCANDAFLRCFCFKFAPPPCACVLLKQVMTKRPPWHLVGDEVYAVADSHSPVLSPVYNHFTEYHATHYDPTSTLVIRIETMEALTDRHHVVG